MIVSEPTRTSADDRPWQFRVRSALLVVVASSVLLAIMQYVSATWSVVIVWTLLLVIAHVAANVWGTRVRQARRRVSQQEIDTPPSMARLAAVKQTHGPSRLMKNTRPGWLVVVFTSAGALVGGSFGTLVLVLMYFGTVGNEAIVLGGASAAVIGGFFGFLVATFVGITTRALREASEPERRR